MTSTSAMTKGDVVTSAGSGAALLGVGTNTHVLTADSTQANGIKWAAPSSGSGWVLISTATASSSATLDFTTGINSTYNLYCFIFDGLKCATDGVTLQMRTSANAGSSWDSGGTDYFSGTTATWAAGGSQNVISVINGSQGNSTNEFINGYVFAYNPSASQWCIFQGGSVYQDTSTLTSSGYMFGSRRSAAAVNGVRFFFNSGNLASGTIKLYGCCAP